MTETTEVRGPWFRQEGLIRRELLENAEVTIIGVGGLGSFAAFALAKMGVGSITAIDHDSVEMHNVGNQLYSEIWLGQAKVHALEGMLADMCPQTKVEPIATLVTRRTILEAPVIVSCVDKMAARKEIWEALKRSQYVQYYIDMRAGAEAIRVLTLRLDTVGPAAGGGPNEQESECSVCHTVWSDDEDVRGHVCPVCAAKYEETLHSDEEALAAPCTARAIIYTAFFAGAIVANKVKAWFVGERRSDAGLTDTSFHCPSLSSL